MVIMLINAYQAYHILLCCFNHLFVYSFRLSAAVLFNSGSGSESSQHSFYWSSHSTEDLCPQHLGRPQPWYACDDFEEGNLGNRFFRKFKFKEYNLNTKEFTTRESCTVHHVWTRVAFPSRALGWAPSTSWQRRAGKICCSCCSVFKLRSGYSATQSRLITVDISKHACGTGCLSRMFTTGHWLLRIFGIKPP